MMDVIKAMINVIKTLVLDHEVVMVVPRPLALPLPPISPLRRSFWLLVEWQVVRHHPWLVPVIPGMISSKVSVRVPDSFKIKGWTR